MGFTGFYLVFPGLNGALAGFRGCRRLFARFSFNFTGFYLVWQGLTWLSRVFFQCYRVLPSFTGFSVVPSVTDRLIGRSNGHSERVELSIHHEIGIAFQPLEGWRPISGDLSTGQWPPRKKGHPHKSKPPPTA